MNKFEQIINEKLKNYQAPEIPNAWDDFSKTLPKNGNIAPKSNWVWWMGGAALMTATAILLFYFYNGNINENRTQSEAFETRSVKTSDINNKSNQQTVVNASESAVMDVKHTLSSNNINTSTENSNPSELNSTNTNNSIAAPNEVSSLDKVHSDEVVSNQGNTANNTTGTIDISSINASCTVIRNCQPAEVLFSATNLPNGYSVNWITGTGENSNQIATDFIYAEAGSFYPICHIYNNDAKLVRSIKLQEIIVLSSPTVNFTFESKNNLYTFSTLSENDINYLWEVDNQKFNTESFDYIFKKEGNYLVKLTVKNEMGCTSEKSELVAVSINHNYFVPNAFKPMSDGINSTFGPIGDNLFEYSFKMLIFDKTGRLIFETNNVENLWNGRFNGTGALAEPGVYSWEIMTTDKYGNYKHKKGQVTLLIN